MLRIQRETPHAYLFPGGRQIVHVLVRVPECRDRVVKTLGGEASRLDPPGFGLWRAAELDHRTQALGITISSDHSAPERIADFGAGGFSHYIRYIRRDDDGWPELHEDIINFVSVKTGLETCSWAPT